MNEPPRIVPFCLRVIFAFMVLFLIIIKIIIFFIYIKKRKDSIKICC